MDRVLNSEIDQLYLDVQEYQSVLKRLNSTNSVKQLAEIFGMILLENFNFSGITIFFKAKDTIWEKFFTTNDSNGDLKIFLNQECSFNIKSIGYSSGAKCIHLPMIDQSQFGLFIESSHSQILNHPNLKMHLYYLESAYQLLSLRIKERELNFSQNHRIVQLTGLLDTSLEIARLKESNDVLQKALQKIVALTNAARGVLIIKEENEMSETYYYPVQFSYESAIDENSSISEKFDFNGKEYRFLLIEKESREGIIEFDATDLLLLQAFCRQVQVSLENQFFYQQSMEKERLDHEILLAGEIQQQIIPDVLPQIPGFSIEAEYIPAKMVGGDFYDCIALQDGRFFFVIADVAGKGVAASLLVNTLHAALHAHLERFVDLVTIVRQLNRIIFDCATTEKYLTAFFALLDPQKKTLTWVNAGHNPAYFVTQNGTIEELQANSIPLGFLPVLPECCQTENYFKPGESVLMYTDGVTEAMNLDEQVFDEILSLKKVLSQNRHLNADQFTTFLLKEIQAFAVGVSQSDDITALYLKADDVSS